MMPHHRNMVRSQCRVAASFGSGVAASLATIRLSPQAGKDASLKSALVEMLGDLPLKPGLTSAHLLITDTPTTAAPTAEQKIRGGDATADWIVLLSGYDPEAVTSLVATRLSAAALRGLGAQDNATMGRYQLGFTMTPQDVAAP
jgi:hypothetical protein